MGLTLPAFAKINLTLELLGRRPDGYTEIRTVYQTVALHDRLRMRLVSAGAGIAVRVSGGGAPAGRANIVHRALARACRALGLRRGVEVELEKNIPAASGLGGGSSDAAAAIVGLLRLAGERLPAAELARLAAETGADVPYFFLGGRALGVGRGEEVYALEDAAPEWVVLVTPAVVISTRQAYRWAATRLTL
ncbi:MAG: 4-(cytidine 5'-diphospho)-2-C-methyl-D-erythritol kinase, partial [Candidatus Acidiferrales bacterium]